MSFKNLLLILFFAAFANAVFAQNDTNNTEDETPEPTEGRRFGAQLLAGFTAAQLDGDGMLGYNHLGANAGLRAFIRIAPKFTTSLDLLYVQTGAQAGRVYTSTYKTIDLDYVQVPIMVHYADWKVQGGLGLSYSRLINSRFILFTTGSNDESAVERMRNFDVCLHVEGTYFINQKWGVQLQYAQGLINTDSRNVLFTDTRYSSIYLYSHYLTMRALYNL